MMSSDCDSQDVPSLTNFEIRRHRRFCRRRICLPILGISIVLAFIATIIGLILGFTWGMTPPIARVLTACGEVDGEINNGIYHFLGLPYAQPPVGKLRFQRPRDIYTISGCPGGIIKRATATSYKPQCLQRMPTKDTVKGSEDCLYLNVYSPDIREGAKRPVIVVVGGLFFLFGGGNEQGFQVTPELVKATDAVHVTINTRLGAIGFLPSVESNIGLWDIISALHWVKNFIPRFGGDPDNVMLFGYGSGATSALALSMSISTTTFDLFHKIWVASPMLMVGQKKNDAIEKYKKDLGCISPSCLANKTAVELTNILTLDSKLLNAWFDVPNVKATYKPSFLLKNDVLIRQSPTNATHLRLQDVPVVIGSTTNEVDVYLWPDSVRFWEPEDIFKRVKSHLQLNAADLDKVRSLYPSSSGSVENIFTRLVTDIRETCPLLCFSYQLRPRSQRLYQYVVSNVGRYVDPYLFDFRINNSFHGWDALLYFSDGSLNRLASATPSDAEVKMRNRIRQAVKQFARTGQIQEFNANGVNVFNKNGDIESIQSYKKQECKLWKSLSKGSCYMHAWDA